MEPDRRRWLARAAGTAVALCVGNVRAASGNDGAMTAARTPDCPALLAHSLRPLAGGEPKPLCERFSGSALLIVNTASRCGFTPQLEALERLHGRYAERGLRVLGFPSDDFRQELADEAEIASFCRLNYGVTFPMFQKIGVTGRGAHPLYQDLAAAADGYPRWNFNKYLVDRDARVLARYDSSVTPLGKRLLTDIEAIL